MIFCLILLVCCVGCHRAHPLYQCNFVVIFFYLVRSLDNLILAIISTLMTNNSISPFQCRDPFQSLINIIFPISTFETKFESFVYQRRGYKNSIIFECEISRCSF